MVILVQAKGRPVAYGKALESSRAGFDGRPGVLTDREARAVAYRFATPAARGLTRLASGWAVSDTDLLDEITVCMRSAVRRDALDDQSALWALSRWVIDTAHSTGATSPDDCLSCAYGASAACTCGEGWQ